MCANIRRFNAAALTISHLSSQKVFFRYNQATEQYERVFPDRKQRIMASARAYIWAIVTVTTIALALYYMVDSPREKALRQQNEALKQRFELLNRRAEQALAVMEDIAERDNNFYRVMMQAEPMTPALRYAGLERQRNYDRLDSMADSPLLNNIDRKLDRLDHMLVSQIKSFDFLASENTCRKTAPRTYRPYSPCLRNICAQWPRATARAATRCTAL